MGGWGLALLAMLVLHRAKLLASNQSVLALGVAPRRVAGTPVPVFTIFENGVWGVAPSGVRAAAPHSPPSLWEGGRGMGIVS